MKVATTFLTTLVTIVVFVAGCANASKPALMWRRVHGAREVFPHSGHISRHVHRNSLSAVDTRQPLSPAARDSLAVNTGPVNGLVNVTSTRSCGPSGATKKITALSGPNGNISFLNCGLMSGGWTPPLIHIDGIVSVELSKVAYNPESAFYACTSFVPLFEKYAAQYGVPAIMLASFAMQESSCNPATVGGGGEQGMMQITPDKCGGAPDGNCKDPDFNIQKGAHFFSEALKSANGDVLRAVGRYNGWYKRMTYEEATAAGRDGNCREQNNLDYLHQYLNGWMQGVNAYEHNPPLGEYFNLNDCPN